MPRLAKSIEDMAVFCPDLAYQSYYESGVGIWTGELSPLRSLDHLDDLLDDIHHNRDLCTAWRGELRHLPGCRASHDRHDWMDRIRAEELLRPFSISIYYAGGAEDPRCRVAGVTRTNGRHVWDDDSICPFLSSKAAWDWTRETVADFVGHVSIWLVTWMVFQQTNVWIVGEHYSTPGYHLSAIRPNDHCWCRSGKKYRKCHLQKDQIDFVRSGR